MNRLMATLFIIPFLTAPTLANEELPDLYIEDMHFSACDEPEVESPVSQPDYKLKVIRGDDESYYDIAYESESEAGYMGSIYRTYCFTYILGNKGDVAISTNANLSSDTFPWEQFSITDLDWVKVDLYQGGITAVNLEPGDFYSANGSIRINLNDNAHSGQNCIGVSVDLRSKDELDKANNRKTLCFEPGHYSIPKAPENFIATKAEGQILEVTWDDVEGADGYKIRAINVAANADFKRQEPVSLIDNKAVFDFDNQDLHCMVVNAVKNGLISADSHRFCYGTLIWRFKDVPIDSWYFPYMQELQANDIFDGYKDEDGNHTGYFGPADELTVSEALKLALYFNPAIRNYDRFNLYSEVAQLEPTEEITNLKNFLEGGFEVPSHLKGHWAEELFRKAYVLDFTLAKNLENLDPNRSITRGEIMELLTESFNVEPPNFDQYSLTDIETTKYADLVEYWYQKGYINGYPDSTFKVDNPLNRAEAVKIINKFYRYRGR